MPEFLSPGHFVTEEDPQVTTILGVPTSTCALIGVAEKGPIGVATLCTSYSDFREKFGRFTPSGWLAYAGYGLYLNQPSARVYVVRVAHYTDVNDPATLTAIASTGTIKDRATPTAANTLKVKASSPGTWGDKLKVRISDSTTTGKFNLEVLETISSGDVVRERFEALSMEDGAADYVETKINGVSRYIVVEDLGSTATGADANPATGTTALAGGDDGLTGITDADYLGSAAAKNGLHALDNIPDILNIAIPGVTTSAVQNGLLSYLENRKNCFAYLDPPLGLDKQQIATHVAGLNSTYAAIAWPNVKILDPVTGAEKVVPPSGWLLGATARTDGEKGVWKTPAGTEDGRLVGVVGLETEDVNEKGTRDFLYPKRINPICFLRGYGIRFYGGRTLDHDGRFPYINERRTFLFCEQSVSEGTQWAEFENNSEKLWKRLTLAIRSFLRFVWKQDGLRGDKAEQAFVVKIDSETNTQEFIDRGICTGLIGLSTHRPAEFIWFRYYRKTADTEE